MANKYTTYFLALLSVILSVKAVDNCFFGDHLTYIYPLPDFTGNYTSVKEYWLR